ncbi:MAG: hypothetical protein WD069_14825 [Planctomycetales bacterium]
MSRIRARGRTVRAASRRRAPWLLAAVCAAGCGAEIYDERIEATRREWSAAAPAAQAVPPAEAKPKRPDE